MGVGEGWIETKLKLRDSATTKIIDGRERKSRSTAT